MTNYVARLCTVLALTVALAGCAKEHPSEGERADDRGDEDKGGRADSNDDEDAGEEDGEPDAAVDDDDDDDVDEAPMFAIDEVDPPCDEQIEEALDSLPDDLACIGLYRNVRDKIPADGVRRFAPAVSLWSDGSGKQRWVYLPPGETIDASDENDWVFPVGTKFFKEFRVHGRRVETRIFQKTRKDRWVRAAYEWDRQELGATRSFGNDRDDVLIGGVRYHVPDGRECDQCHSGRKDRVLGFEAVSLGLPGAQGVTLNDLVDEGLLSPSPRRTELSIGDDGSGVSAQVFSWMHINCGVGCHNDNQNAEAYSSGLRLKLNAFELDGRPPNGFEAMQSLVEAKAKSQRWGDQTRVIPGSPGDSLMYRLITSRAGPKEQMPPIATAVVDTANTELVRRWIEHL